MNEGEALQEMYDARSFLASAVHRDNQIGERRGGNGVARRWERQEDGEEERKESRG